MMTLAAHGDAHKDELRSSRPHRHTWMLRVIDSSESNECINESNHSNDNHLCVLWTVIFCFCVVRPLQIQSLGRLCLSGNQGLCTLWLRLETAEL